MKWKRSKKAQQEAKSGKESSSNSENLNKAQPSVNTTPKTNNTNVVESQTENQGNARKVQEGESLYRPYVV